MTKQELLHTQLYFLARTMPHGKTKNQRMMPRLFGRRLARGARRKLLASGFESEAMKQCFVALCQEYLKEE